MFAYRTMMVVIVTKWFYVARVEESVSLEITVYRKISGTSLCKQASIVSPLVKLVAQSSLRCGNIKKSAQTLLLFMENDTIVFF